jgi:sporulation protein YlmC with PRC-barrel domain
MALPLTTSESLRRLSDADYEVAPGEYDVRGWHVIAANDEKVGTVDDLIIDPAAGKVRYLEVDIDRKAVGLDRDRHVLIPVGSAQLDCKDKVVLLSGMTRAALSTLPDYTGANFASERGYLSTAYPSKRMTRSVDELR